MAKKGGGYGVGKANAKLERAFTGQKANLIATRKMLKTDRLSEFYATNARERSIFKNLTSTMNGTAKNLTQDQARQLRALGRVTSGKAEGRISTRAADTVRNMYGIAGSGFAAPAEAVLAAKAKGAKTTLGGQRKAGGLLANANESAMKTIETGVKAEALAAKGQVAQALQYRAKNDAALISQQKTALATARIQAAQAERDMRLQAQLDYKNWQKQQGTNPGAAGAVAQAGVTSYNQLADAFRTPVATDGTPLTGDALTAFNQGNGAAGDHYMNATEAAQYVEGNMAIGANDPRATIIQTIAGQMFANGAGSSQGHYKLDDAHQQSLVHDAVTQSLQLLYPDMNGKKLASVTQAGMQYFDSVRAYNGATGGGGGGGGSTTDAVDNTPFVPGPSAGTSGRGATSEGGVGDYNPTPAHDEGEHVSGSPGWVWHWNGTSWEKQHTSWNFTPSAPRGGSLQ